MAIDNNVWCFGAIKNPSEEICWKAIKYQPGIIEDIEKPTVEMCVFAVSHSASVFLPLRIKNSKEFKMAMIERKLKAV